MVCCVPFSTAAAASLLLLPSVLAAGLYSKDSPVVQVDGRSYDSLIAKSNHTSIVEFYAPWCGHCKNLQPAFEKAAKSLSGLAKVAAVNCDDDSNKPFCGSMGVQGFPTLKIVKPGRIKDGKRSKPIVEDYQGARSAKAIVDAVIDKIPNYVKRLSDKGYEAWLDEGDGPKAILFSDKGTTSPVMKAIAVDFLGGISVAQIRNKEKEALEVFNVEKFPTLVLLPGNDKDPITYEGEMKKQGMVDFLSQAVPPNPDPAPKKDKPKNKSDSVNKSSSAKTSQQPAPKKAKSAASSPSLVTVYDETDPTAPPVIFDPSTLVKVKVRDMPPIAKLSDGLSLQQECLNTKSGTCILVILPLGDESAESKDAMEVTTILSEIQFKHKESGSNLFPFFQLPPSNSQANALRSQLNLSADVELIALNGKRSWYRHYTKPHTTTHIEEWIDAIRMGDGEKQKVPTGLIMNVNDLPPEPVKIDTSDPEALREALKNQMPEGIEFEMEEIDDNEYDRLMANGEKAGKRDEL